MHDIFDFAEKHLQPFYIKNTSKGAEITPQYCPFCNGGDHGDRKTFSLNAETGVFICHRGSCGKKGRVEDLAEFLKTEPPSGFQRNKIKPTINYKLPETQLHPRTEKINKYFAKRDISQSTLNVYDISADKDGNIVFPFYRDRIYTFLKFREPRKWIRGRGQKEWRESGTEPILFGMDHCTPDKPLIVTEGMIDLLALHEAGVRNIVSVPSGYDDLTWINLCWDWLEKFDTFILFGDNDDPGRKMVDSITKRLGEDRCRSIKEYPLKNGTEECKDANEILHFCGPFVLMDMVEDAQSAPIRGLKELADVKASDPTKVERIKTMIPELDESINGLLMGAITIITGMPGGGKSSLSGPLLLNAVEQGYNVCAYSGELTEEEFLYWTMLQTAGSDWITLKYDPVKEKQVPIVPENVQERIMQWYRGHFYIYDNTEIFETNEADTILKLFVVAARRYGCKLFLIDNVLTALAESEEETKAQGKFVNKLKKFATKYGVHVLIVAHARKTKSGEKIGLDDISGNSALVKLAHSGLVAEKPNIRIIKARDAGLNRLIECCYCADSRRIYQANKGDLNNFSWDKTGIESPKIKANSMADYGVFMAQGGIFG